MKKLAAALLLACSLHATMIVTVRFRDGIVSCGDKHSIDFKTGLTNGNGKVKVFKWREDVIFSTEGTLRWGGTELGMSMTFWDSQISIPAALQGAPPLAAGDFSKYLVPRIVDELNYQSHGRPYALTRQNMNFKLDVEFYYLDDDKRWVLEKHRIISTGLGSVEPQRAPSEFLGDTSSANVYGSGYAFDVELREGSNKELDKLRKHPSISRFVLKPVSHTLVTEREATNFAKWYILQANTLGEKLEPTLSIGAETDCVILLEKKSPPTSLPAASKQSSTLKTQLNKTQ